MKLECFLLPPLVLSLLGHLGHAGPNNPKRGGGHFGATSTNSGGNFGGNDGNHFGGSSEGSSGSSKVLGGNIGATTSESLGSVGCGRLGSDLRDGVDSSDATRGSAHRGPGFSSGRYGSSTGIVGSPLGEGLSGIPSVFGAGVPVSHGDESSGYLTGNGVVGRGFTVPPNIGTGPFGGNLPGVSTSTGDPLSRISPIPQDYRDVMAGARPPERSGTETDVSRGYGGIAGPGVPENRPAGTGFSGGSGGVGGPGLPERATTGTAVSGGYNGGGAPVLPDSGSPRTGVSGVGALLEALPRSPPPNSPDSYGTGFPGGARLPNGNGNPREGLTARFRGLGRSAGEGIGGLGARLAGLERIRHSLGLSESTPASFLARLRARLYAPARALAAAHARARARAKARARARAFALAKLRARLRTALRKRLSIGGGIYAGLDKEVELTGALSGGAGLHGEGGAGAGFAGNGGPRASATAGNALYGGTVGSVGSYGGYYGGDYEFYSE